MDGLKEGRTFSDDGLERGAIVWVFGYRFAEVPGLPGPVVDGEREMVRGDGARDGVAEALDALDGGARRRVLEDDAQAREARVERAEVREERGLGVEHAGVRRGGRGHLAVEVEDHAGLLHRGEDGVVRLVRLDPALRVGGYAARVRFDACRGRARVRWGRAVRTC